MSSPLESPPTSANPTPNSPPSGRSVASNVSSVEQARAVALRSSSNYSTPLVAYSLSVSLDAFFRTFISADIPVTPTAAAISPSLPPPVSLHFASLLCQTSSSLRSRRPQSLDSKSSLGLRLLASRKQSLRPAMRTGIIMAYHRVLAS